MADGWIKFSLAVILGGAAAVWGGTAVFVPGLALGILLTAAVLFWQPRGFWGYEQKPLIIFLALGLLAGFLCGATGERCLAPPLTLARTPLEGRLLDWWVEGDNAQGVIRLSASAADAQGGAGGASAGAKYALRVWGDAAQLAESGWAALQPGDTVSFTGDLIQPEPPLSGGDFDAPLFYATRGLSGKITARSEAAALEEGRPPPAWRLRLGVRRWVEKHWPGREGVIEGILFGQTSRLAEEDAERYKITGVYHVFAASGSNVAFVIALAWAGCFFLPRRARIMAVLAAVVFYALLCNGNPPILRASLLGGAVLLGRLGQGRVSGLRWLALTAMGLFALNPLYLKDISFLLSYGATWGILVVTPALDRLSWLRGWPPALRAAVLISIGAQLAITPLLLTAFQRLSLIGLAANVAVLFLLGAVLELGLLGMLTLWLPPLAYGFYQAAVWLVSVSDALLALLAQAPGAYVWVVHPGLWFYILWYVCLFLWVGDREKLAFQARVQIRRLAAFCGFRLRSFSAGDGAPGGGEWGKRARRLLPLAVLLLLLYSPWDARQGLEITFLSVGQGDCILIRTARETALIDTGPRDERRDAGEDTIMPYLLRQGVRRLDYVFLTHEDADHTGGLPFLLNNIPIGRLILPDTGDRLNSRRWAEVLTAAAATGLTPAQTLYCQAGDELTFASGMRISVAGPAEILDWEGDGNEHSLVFYLSYAGYTVFFTGDMGLPEMETLRARGYIQPADFIKIPHHGSKNSMDAAWWDRFAPRAVFVQAGAKNSFGHPAAEVTEYWEERAVPLYRNDTQGTIRLMVKNGAWTVESGRD
ncbi:MAG: ComEC/Rec2 family competence protein [Gracilibacteraceae bacterium]|jgi:competence protein ComEC|nr:ComEC/Rec2 family competence protein [Gracilibacteraceae bacterium]